MPETKATIKSQRDAMARLLLALCKQSDTLYGGQRQPATEKYYQTARRLLRRAGFKYEPRQ